MENFGTPELGVGTNVNDLLTLYQRESTRRDVTKTRDAPDIEKLRTFTSTRSRRSPQHHKRPHPQFKPSGRASEAGLPAVVVLREAPRDIEIGF